MRVLRQLLVQVRLRLLPLLALQLNQALEIRLLNGRQFNQLLDPLHLLFGLDLLIGLQLHQDAASTSLHVFQLVCVLPDFDQGEDDGSYAAQGYEDRVVEAASWLELEAVG